MELPTPSACSICSRPSSSHLPFHCITCARNILYGPRLDHAQVLIQKEALGKEIERAVTEGTDTLEQGSRGKASPKTRDEAARCVAMEQTRSLQAEAEERTRKLRAEIESLRDATKKLRITNAEKTKKNAQRRAAHDAAIKELHLQETQAVAPLQKQIATLELKWDKIHDRTAEARMLLCREAASLYNLQQRKRRKGSSARDVYYMGNLPIIDLRDLNSMLPSTKSVLTKADGIIDADPAQVNVSTENVAHLLHLASHYLSLRLPAEIILPSPNNPHPAIRTPLSSYKTPTLPAGLRAAAVAATSPNLQTHHPRDRVLYLEKPLNVLAAEDPLAAGLYVDAVTLLAWDAAWLARAQGLDVGARSWEEICNVGRTLWTVFVAPPPPPPSVPSTRSPRSSPRPAFARLVPPAQAETASPSRPSLNRAPSSPASKVPTTAPTGQAVLTAPSRGQLAHGTAHGYLAAAGPGGGADWMRGWRFASHVRVIERIKGALASERMGAEWEVLEKDEWEQEGADVTPGHPGAAVDELPVPEAGKSNNTETDRKGREESTAAVSKEKERAKKGWTKVRTPAEPNT